MAQAVVDDVYLLILTVDGEEYVDKLRARMQRTADEVYPSTSNEKSWLFSKP